MAEARRIVVDTNVFVSAIGLPRSIPRQEVDKVLDEGVLLISESTLHELAEVLARKKLAPYVTRELRSMFLSQLMNTAELVHIAQFVRECRDPKDDKFLELALNGRADLLITGDQDLLAMDPWRGIAIVSAQRYLNIAC